MIEVAVVASGPVPEDRESRPDVTAAYFANSAIWRRTEFPNARVINVLGNPVLHASTGDENIEARRSAISGTTVDRCVVSSWLDPADVRARLARLNYTAGHLDVLSVPRREQLTQKGIGRGLPASSFMAQREFAGFNRYLKRRLKQTILRRPFLPPLHARVSTGVFAIILASLETPPSTPIWVSGISFTAGDTVLESGTIPATTRGHMPADLIACRRLAKRRMNLSCSDLETCEATGWQYTAM